MKFYKNSYAKRQATHFYSQKGMSLVELAIVITIAAIIAVGYLSWMQPPVVTDAEKALATRNKMTVISKAIEAFRTKYNRLPCPADPALSIGTTHQTKGGSAI